MTNSLPSLGKNACGSGYDFDVFCHRGAGAYICGNKLGEKHQQSDNRIKILPHIFMPWSLALLFLY